MGTVRKSFGFFKRVPILSVRTVSFRCKEQLLRFRNSVPVHLKIYDRCIVFCNVDTKNRRNHQQFLPNGSLNSVHVQINIDNLSVLNRRRFVAAGRSLISKEQTNQSKTPGGRKKGSVVRLSCSSRPPEEGSVCIPERLDWKRQCRYQHGGADGSE